MLNKYLFILFFQLKDEVLKSILNYSLLDMDYGPWMGHSTFEHF